MTSQEGMIVPLLKNLLEQLQANPPNQIVKKDLHNLKFDLTIQGVKQTRIHFNLNQNPRKMNLAQKKKTWIKSMQEMLLQINKT